MNDARTVRQNPFPGLRPFTTEEDYLFFGREEQTTELLGRLRQHRFLAVVGTSGSGKSSLVRAGLLPALHGGTMAQAGSSWEVLVLRPGGDPLANLARALVDAELYDPEDEESLPRIVATLNRSRLGLIEAVRQSELPEGTNLLVVVDQFEELFRFRQAGVTHQETAAAFVKLLLAAARADDQRIYIAITMRSDYLGECSHLAGLAEAVNAGEYLIPKLSREQRRAAIEKPVSVGGGTIAHRLVQKLLNDVGDDADHLPVLQHALMRIFDYWALDHADSEPLDLRHYERAGGLQEALSRHADEVFDELANDRLRQITEKLFEALTERGPDNRGIRRPTRLDRLCAIIDAKEDEVVAVVEAFRRSGRTFLMPMSDVALTSSTVIDISHESLMRVWQRLGRWVEEESQSARIYRRLADTAALHAEGKAGTYHDPDLQIALSWREVEHPTEAWAARYHAGFEQALAFLDKSRAVQHAEQEELELARQRELEQARKLAAAEQLQAQVQKRAAQRLRWLSAGVAVVAALALVAFGVAMVAWRDSQRLADKEAQAATDERRARAEAEFAKHREATEKSQAQQARLDADVNRKSAEAALEKAEENFAKARTAVNDYLTAVSEDEQLKAPGLQNLRVQLLQSALQFYQQFLKERGNDPTLRRELAGVYYKVGDIYRDLGQFKASNPAYAQARTLYEALAAESPDDRELQHALAKALQWTGARARAIAILEKLIDPVHPRYHADLGDMYNSEALQADKKGKVDNARQIDLLHKSLTLRERLVRLKPDDPDARIGYAGSLNNIAIRLKAERSDEALVLIQRAAAEMETAYRLRPNHLLTVRYLTIGLNNVARWGKVAGDTELVLASHRRRVEVLDRRARENPGIVGFAGDLALGYASLLTELRDAERLDEASKTAEKARLHLAEVNDDTKDFLQKVVNFHLAVHALALARAKADGGGGGSAEPEAAAVVSALRQYTLGGWYSAKYLQSQPSLQAFRQRADFKELQACHDELNAAHELAAKSSADVEAKLAARQTILTALADLAGEPPHARLVRRNLAQARQYWAQALLEAGQVPEARQAFDEALLARQQLLQEAPANEELRADLAQSQSAAGDLFAAAGKLADAVTTWDKALATLEEALKASPNSIALQTALAESLLHIARQAGQVGLWDVAARYYRRAVAIQSPTSAMAWNFMALVAAQTQDKDLARAAADLAARDVEMTGDNALYRLRALTTSPELPATHRAAVQRLSDEIQNPWHNVKWMRALALLRLGQADKAFETVAELTPAEKGWPEWQVLALIRQRLGHVKEAAEALRQADLLAEKRMQGIVAGERLKLPLVWDEWPHNQALRAEAHQAIHGRPMPESPYEQLYRARVLHALGRHDEAEVGFAGAVARRPDDADVWLTRSRLFATLGQTERMTADLLRAQQLKGDDPKTWIETGRMLAERGEQQPADAAFARASALAKGELNRFLDAGWWVVGPYPDELDLPCPPESNPDPSRPVAAVGDRRTLKWQSVRATPHTNNIQFPAALVGQDKATSYALTYAYADRDRTAVLHLLPKHDARLWVNGRLVFAGFGAGKATGIQVPVTLRQGRNTLLVKNRHDKGATCEVAFLDAPIRQAYELRSLALWHEAADAFAQAERRAPLHEYPSRLRVQCLVAAGRDEEARQVFAEMVSRHGRPGGHSMAEADWLPPGKSEERERGLTATRKYAEAKTTETWRLHRLAHACFRAGQFAEAEANLRKALSSDQLYFQPLLASILHHLGKSAEARKVLAALEERHAKLVKNALAAATFRVAQPWESELWYQVHRREARLLILGNDAGPSADESALVARARTRATELDKVEDHYALLVAKNSGDPRLWVDRGRRLGELQRWEEAAEAFGRALKLKPKDETATFWNARGRAYADLGKWDEAAADFAQALDLGPAAPTVASRYNWWRQRHAIDDAVLSHDELFDRLTKLRPINVTLLAAKVSDLVSRGRFKEAAAVQVRAAELLPKNPYARQILALLRWAAGDHDAYATICRELLPLYQKSTDPKVIEPIAVLSLLNPDVAVDRATLEQWSLAASKDLKLGQVAHVLAEYRLGNHERVVECAAHFARAFKPHLACLHAVQAASLAKLGRITEAADALQKARREAEGLPRPGRIELPDKFYWWESIRADALIQAAEKSLPAVPAQLAQAAPSAAEQTAQRERKARADSLGIQVALAQVRLDSGQKKEAEAGLRAVLAEREKIAAEEPASAAYQADLAATRLRLAQFLADSGQVAEASQAAAEVLPLLDKLAAEEPKDLRLRVEAARVLQAIGNGHASANQPAAAMASWKQGIEALRAALQKSPDHRSLLAALAQAEAKLGDEYGALALWAEAGDLLAAASRRSVGDAWTAARAAQALLAAGDRQALARLAADALPRLRDKTSDATAATCAAIIGGLADGLAGEPERLLDWARFAAAEFDKEPWRQQWIGVCEYRAGRYEDALHRLDVPNAPDEARVAAFVAMAHHRLGHKEQARDGLARAEKANAALILSLLSQSRPLVDWWGSATNLGFYREAHELITGKPLPLDPLERLYRAQAYLRLGESSKGELELQAAVTARPDDPLVCLARSRVYLQLGRPQEAAADRARAQELIAQTLTRRPDDGAAAEALAGLVLDKVEPKSHPDWFVAAATPHAKAGAAYLVTGDAKASAEFLTKAIAANPKPGCAEYVVLALAHTRLKDSAEAGSACAQAAKLLRPAGADEALRPLLREVALSLGTNQPAVQELIAAAAGEPPVALNDAIVKNPDRALGYRQRGSWFGARGRWREAIADLTEAIRLEPDDMTGMWLGILLVHTGDLERFRAHSLAQLERYWSTEKNPVADRTLKTALLHPDIKHEAGQLARLAQVAVSGARGVDWYEWFLFAKGLHDCRTGKYDDALATCRESRRRAPAGKGPADALTALNLAVEALALHAKGDAAEARRTLDQTSELLKQHVPGLDVSGWQDWLIAHILCREVEGLMAAKKQAGAP